MVVFAVILLVQISFVSATLTENSWESKKAIPTGRLGCGSIAVNGLIYVIGGSHSDSSTANEMFNPATDTWTVKKSMPTPRAFFGIAAYQNKIYVIGGNVIGGTSSFGGEEVTGVNEVYDTVTDTWETKTAMSTARGFMCANIVDSKIYVIGGSTPASLNWINPVYVPNVNEVYDIATDTWSSKTPPPVNVSYYASAVIDSKIYLITNSEVAKSVLIYDTKTDSWSYGTPISTPVNGAAAGVTTGRLAPKRLYVIGGHGAFDRVQIYDPEKDKWTLGATMPTGRYGLSVSVVDDILYAFGGSGSDGMITNERYIPQEYNTSALPPNETTLPENVPSKELLPDDKIAPTNSNIILATITIATIVFAVTAIVLKTKKRT